MRHDRNGVGIAEHQLQPVPLCFQLGGVGVGQLLKDRGDLVQVVKLTVALQARYQGLLGGRMAQQGVC